MTTPFSRRALGSFSIVRFGWLLSAVVGMALLGTIATAADITWNGTDSSGVNSWNDPLNWNNGVLPNTGDRAYIGAGGTANIDTTPPTVLSVYVGGTGDQGNPEPGNGTLNQTGGTLTVTDWFTVGDAVGDTGTYNLSGGSINVTSTDVFEVGEYGTGNFNLTGTGSVVNANGTFVVGRWGDATATGYGTVVQGAIDDAGTTSVSANEMDIGAVGRTGAGLQTQNTYTLNSGTISTTADFNIGPATDGNGLMTVNGGSITTGGTLNVGRDGGSNGLMVVNNGSITVGNGFNVGGGTGELDVNGGMITASNGDSFVGNGGVGLVKQTDGTVHVAGGVWLRIGQGGQGTYDISGAGSALQVNGRVVVGEGGQGSVVQTGGQVNVVSDVTIGDNTGTSSATNPDTYTISGGSLNTTGTDLGGGPQGLLLGWQGTAVFNQNGGAVNVGGTGLQFGGNGGSGTYNLNSGTLSVSNFIVLSGTSTFNFNGGTLRATAPSPTFTMTGINTANIRDGGAVIDTNGNNITIDQALVHSTIGGDAGIDGGLTKSGGSGTLTLTNTNTYTGPTNVNVGTLALAALSAATTSPTRRRSRSAAAQRSTSPA